MTKNWERLGEEIRASRIALGCTQAELAAGAGVSRASVQNLEQGRSFKRTTPSMRAVTDFLGWPPQRLAQILETAPGVQARSPADEQAAAGGDLPARVSAALVNGSLLDAQVMELGGEAQVIVVVRGKSDASQDEIRTALERWQRAEKRLRNEGEGAPQGGGPRP
ncbi:helix-turn-helix transcriptional regulator [Streptomyces sp. NPDC047097]|uniref:helix-turn-helix domain-containing protein n=1 Tax=Streptomyces sp. NPDC047097 TaxID=3155260 RepID=UPI0033CD172F